MSDWNELIMKSEGTKDIPTTVNKYPDGFDPLMIDGDGMMMRTLKRCYKKHVSNDDAIGWDELSDELGNTLAQAMGDKEFQAWVGSLDT